MTTPAAVQTDQQQYVRAVLRCYTRLPHTPNRSSSHDRRLALQLFEQQVPLDAVKAAFVLAISRRTFRPLQAAPLGPIRSLAYFLPVIDEVQLIGVDPLYIDHLKRRLESGIPIPAPIPW